MTPPLTLARQAMATRFEIALHGDNPISLRAAGEEAFDEIERIEARLSLYRPTSEIAHVNARAAREAVRVSPATFRLLKHAVNLSAETGGAFDITIGPLMRCWGFVDGTGRMPTPEALAEARARTGMNLVELDAARFTVRFAREGVMLDLGAIGKNLGDDLAEGKMTLPLIHLLQQGDEAGARIVREIIGNRTVESGPWSELLRILKHHRSIDYAYRRASEFAEIAKTPLYAFPPSAERDALLALPDYILSRDR